MQPARQNAGPRVAWRCPPALLRRQLLAGLGRSRRRTRRIRGNTSRPAHRSKHGPAAARGGRMRLAKATAWARYRSPATTGRPGPIAPCQSRRSSAPLEHPTCSWQVAASDAAHPDHGHGPTRSRLRTAFAARTRSTAAPVIRRDAAGLLRQWAPSQCKTAPRRYRCHTRGAHADDRVPRIFAHRPGIAPRCQAAA